MNENVQSMKKFSLVCAGTIVLVLLGTVWLYGPQWLTSSMRNKTQVRIDELQKQLEEIRAEEQGKNNPNPAVEKTNPEGLILAKIQLEKDFAQVEANARTAIGQFLVGLAALAGIYTSLLNLRLTRQNSEKTLEISSKTLEISAKNSEKTLEISSKTLEISSRNLDIAIKNMELTEEGKMAERFSKAIEYFSKDETRLGGVYSLEQVARAGDRYYWVIMELITAYIREVAKPAQPAGAQPIFMQPTLEAALTLIKRRAKSFDNGEDLPLNLKNISIPEADLSEANFCGANLQDANLDNVQLFRTQLNNANLSHALLNGAVLAEAKLIGANLNNAKLCKAALVGADLTNADLTDAMCKDTDFSGAILTGAYLSGADLSTAQNLTIEQIQSVKTKDFIQLPAYLPAPLSYDPAENTSQKDD